MVGDNMKNKKGFTLVELLAVLAVLSILLVIGTSSMARIIKKHKQDLYAEQIKSFEESAKDWGMKNASLLPADGSSLKLTLGTLKSAKFVKEGIKDPITGEVFEDINYVCIFNTNGTYLYTYNGEC